MNHASRAGATAFFNSLLVLVLGLGEGLATVLAFEPGALGFAPLVGLLLFTIWLIWTGILCIVRPAANV